MDVSSFYYADSSDNKSNSTRTGTLAKDCITRPRNWFFTLLKRYCNVIHCSGVLLQWMYDFLLSEYSDNIYFFWIMDGQLKQKVNNEVKAA